MKKEIVLASGERIPIQRKKHVGKKIALHSVLIVLSVLFLFPFFYMLFMSFMGDVESNTSMSLFPAGAWTLSAYARVFDNEFWQWTFNSFIVIVFNLIVVPLASSLCAFGFTRCRFRGREVCFAIVLATIMLPAMAIQIPLYIIYRRINWVDTLLPFTIPAMFGGGAMNIFLIKQFMRSIPSTLDEAATIDGANRFMVYFRIYLPLCTPILIFTMIGAFNNVWNDFMGPMLYLHSTEKFTLIWGVYRRCGATNYYNNLRMAHGVILVIPAAIVFFIFQKQLIEGVQVGGIKG